MGKRLLASFLAVAMMLTMAPFAFAIDDDTDVTAEYVAKIADKGYESLAEAFAEAEDGDTITLLNSTSGDGIQVTSNKFADKGLTVDFGGNTYTVGGVLVGSSGTGTNAFQLLANNKITLKNGSIVGATENTKPAEDTPNWHGAPAMVIQNYCNLTLDNMTIAGGTETVYTMSNNFANVIIKDTRIDAGAAKGYGYGPYAFDVCRFDSYSSVSVTVQGNSVINGNVEVSGTIGEGQSRQLNIEGGTFNGEFRVANQPANITITGGTFSSDVSDYVASGYEAVAGEDGTWTVKAENVATVNGQNYASLQEAVNAAKDGETVTLLKDVVQNSALNVKKSITLDMNGKKLYNTVDIWDVSNALVRIEDGANVTITGNGTMSAKEDDCYTIAVVDGDLTIKNGTFVGNVSVVQVEKGKLDITGGTFSLLQKWDGKTTYLINCIDDAYRDGTAKVSISGGTFVEFNPANNEAESAGTNFLASGYVTKQVGENYVVKANDNQTVADLDAAIKTIQDETAKGESSDNTKVSTAVDVIKNIDNEDLASNSAAMSKLAELDKELTDSTNGQADVEVVKAVTAEQIEQAKVTVTNAAVSANLTADKPKVTVEIKDTTVDQTKLNEAKQEVLGDVTSTNEVLPLEINLKDEEDNEIHNPVAPVIIEFPLPEGWAGCKLVYVDGDTIESIPTTVIGNVVKATFVHFSGVAAVQTNAVENPNKYQIELTPQDGKATVYPGDEITFDVVLRRTEGNSDTVNTVRFTPTSDMLTVTGGTAAANFTYNTTSKQFTHLDANNPVTLTNGEVKVGTLTCKVNSSSTNHRLLTVTTDEQDTVTVSRYQTSNGLAVAEIPVYYDVIQVYFNNYTGTLDSNGKEGTKLTTFYTYAGSKTLYASLDALKDRTSAANAPTASDGSITDGTQYRLTDDVEGNNLRNWIATTGTSTTYVDVVNGNGFTDNMSFYVSRVKLLEVKKTDDVNIVDSKVTTRDSKTYVDYNEDFTFTVPDAGNGKKNEVTVTVNGKTVTVTPDATDDKYTVGKSDMIDSPVKITVTQVIDLDVNDIGVFDDGLGKFLQYSKYSGEDTLVLIKGDTSVKYTLSSDTETDVPEIYALPTDNGYGDGNYTLAVLVPRPTLTLAEGEDAREAMLKYLKDTYHIAVTEGKNTAIDAYNFDTNGDGNGNGTFKLDDAQATYDFSARLADEMYWEPSDVELLKADVLTYKDGKENYNTPRDGQVTTKDVDAFLYNYVYTPSARPSDTNP